MGTKYKNERGDNLYQFWGDKIQKNILKELKDNKSNLVINLASNEYFSVLGAFPKEVGRCPIFIEYENAQGMAEVKLGDDWRVAPHENLIFDLKKSFQDENVKILYN